MPESQPDPSGANTLLEQRVRFHETILSNTPDLVYVFDLNHRFIYVNRALLAMWGKTLEESLGRNCLELGYEPWHAAMHDRELDEVISSKRPVKGEVPFPHDILGRRIYEYIFVPIFGENGEVEAVCGTTRDVTDRKNAEEHAHFLSALSQKLAFVRTEEEITGITVEHLGRFLGSHRCYFLEWEETGTSVTIHGNWVRDDSPELPSRLDLDDFSGTAPLIPDHDGNLLVADVATNPATRGNAAAYESLRIRSYAAHTLHREGSSILLVATADQPRVWHPRELGLMESVAARVWPLVERARSASASLESERRLRLVSDNVPALISYVDRDGCFRFSNARYAEWFGIPDLTGWHLRDLIGEETYQKRLPYLEKVLQGEPQRFEAVTLHREMGRRDMEISYLPDFAPDGSVRGFFASLFDITDRKQASDALARQRDRLSLLWEAAGIILRVEDPDTMLQLIFSRIRDHLGIDVYLNFVVSPDSDRLLLQSARGIPEEELPSLPRLESGGAVAEKKGPLVFESVHLSDDPQVSFVKSHGVRAYISLPLMTDGRLLGTLSFGSRSRDAFAPDEIEFLETIAHYVTAASARSELLDHLKERDRRKNEFLAILAHELRNPLAPIRTGVGILGKSLPSGSPAAGILATIENQTAQMVRLIDDLLDLSRVTRGKIELQTAPVDLTEVIASAVETSRPLIDASGHQLSLNLPDAPVSIVGDASRLSQVFSNLLNNAARYTPDGGRIDLTLETDGSGVVVRVRDNGRGIHPDMREKIFGMFTQIKDPSGRLSPGLGIGLTLVRLLVEKHGGGVSVSSAGLGKGSEFVIHLPGVLPEPSSARNDAPPPAFMKPAPACKILVADDGASAADMLVMFFELEGFEARATYDGAQALEICETMRPEIVFLDIGMPLLDGYETARRMRRLPGGGDLILVALTGWGQESDRIKTREAGFDHHLVKPVQPQMLREFVGGLLSPK